MTDERHRPPSGTDHTLAATPAVDDTLAATASATGQTLAAPSGNPETVTDDTLAPDSDVVRRHAGASPSSRGANIWSKSGADSQRTVGQEMVAANIERFGRVSHDRFEILDELARGGLGRVFRARDPRTNRIVAIKEVLRPQSDIIARFAREAMVTANLQHPAIVPVYEVGRWDTGEPFYAMKLVHGRTLDDLIGEARTLAGRMALVPHLIHVADALAYAHSEHVIHRDLKPANVLVGAYGETVVIDWGLAKNLATGEEIDILPIATTIPPDNAETIVGAVVGTPAYMPPEQAQGEKVDERADVYAIGAILYHVLAGERPFRHAQTMEELLQLVAYQAPRPIAELAPDAAPELIAIVEKAMARNPDDRYATAAGLAHDLRAFQAGKLVGAHHYTSRQLVRRWVAKHRGTVLTAAVALGILITIGSLGVWRIAKERDVARAEREDAQAQRAEAQRQRGIAELRVADSLEELARQALIGGGPDRALPLLDGAAQARGGSSPTLGILVSLARASYTGLVGVVPPHARGTTTAGLAHGGTWVVSAGADGLLRAWDLAANREVWHTQVARLMALSPDGRSVIGVDGTGRLTVVNVDDGKVLHEWHLDATDSTDIATVLVWAPDSVHFAATTPAGRVFLGAATSSKLAAVDPHRGPAWAVAFSADGTQVATGGKDGTTMIRDVASGTTLAKLVDGPSEIAVVTWIDRGRLFTGDNKGIVRLWSIGERRIAKRLQVIPGAIYGIVIGATPSPWFATFGEGTVVIVSDLETFEVRQKLPGHVIGTDVAAIVRGVLLTTDETGNTFVWDPLSGERLQTLPNEGLVQGVVSSGARALLFGNGRLRVWQIAPERNILRDTHHTARVRDLAWSADSRMLWSASNDGLAVGREIATGKTITFGEPSTFSEPALTEAPSTPPVPNPHGLRSLSLTPDGTRLATAAEDGTLALWNLASLADPPTKLVGHTGRVRRVVFSRDGRFAYSTGDTTLRTWDLATGKQRASVDLGALGWDLALLGDDEVIVTQDDQRPKNQVRLWRANDLSPISTGGDLTSRFNDLFVVGDRVVLGATNEIDILQASGKLGERVAFANPNGAAIVTTGQPHHLVIGGAGGEIGVYEWPSLRPVRSWQSDAFITVVRLRPDERIVATIGGHQVRLWDPGAGRMLADLELPFVLTQLAWSPDGTHLAIAGASGTVWVWDLTPGDPAGLGAFARCASQWKLDDTAIVAAPFDPASCSMLSH